MTSEHGKEMPGCDSDLEALADQLAKSKPPANVIRGVLESVFRDGQRDPSPAAVARVLREAAMKAKVGSAWNCPGESDTCHNHIAKAIEAMIPESER